MGINQQSGMQGVFLVAAELSKRNYIVSPTARNAKGADLLVTNQDCSKAWSIQVKTNTTVFSFFLLGKHDKHMHAKSHFYVFINIRKTATEYYIVPGKIVSKKMSADKAKTGNKDIWYSISCKNIMKYKDRWNIIEM